MIDDKNDYLALDIYIYIYIYMTCEIQILLLFSSFFFSMYVSGFVPIMNLKQYIKKIQNKLDF